MLGGDPVDASWGMTRFTSTGEGRRVGFIVHRSSQAQLLVGALGDVLADIPDDPFTPEVVAVPTRGIERWIAQELSRQLGIAANIRFPTVHTLIEEALAAADGLQAEDDPWTRANLRWHVARAIDDCRGEPWMATVDRFIASGGEHSRRMEAAIRIAGLFHRYAEDRPEMLRAWAGGTEAGSYGSALAEAHLWQPRLWHRVRQSTGIGSPAERLPDAATRIASGGVDLDLPDRVNIYGLTRIPQGHLATLQALAQTRDLHAFVLHPSPTRWKATLTEILDEDTLPPRRALDPDRGHPLVSSWGRDAVELQAVLHHHGIGPTTDHESEADGAPTALGRLQTAIRADRIEPRVPIADDDRSLQIHACHGPARQVEALRDALLHAMTDDPTIQPRDIVVMCPDVETYAPLVEAVFGSPDGDSELPDLRVRVADRAPRSMNPLLAVATAMLDLATGRAGAGEILDFAALGPVLRALDISEAELDEISEMVSEANISWGLDARHRAEGWGLPDMDDHTWRFGLDRLLSGVFLPDTRTDLVGSSLPVPGIEGSTLGGLGRLAELVSRIDVITRSLAEPRSAGRWRIDLLESIEMVAAPEWGSEWQWEHLIQRLQDALATSDQAPVALDEVRTVLSDLGSGRAGRSDHRTGQLTVCTLAPMRSVPHRVIALLGMDDEVFPRGVGRNGDDLLQEHPAMGDHDPCSGDRQLLLDAVMAAQEHLIITYSGHDQRTNAERPPAVPIAELLDVIDRSFTCDDDEAARERVVCHHPLQGFDPRNFSAADARPWGFDPLQLAGAETLLNGADESSAVFIDEPLSWERPDEVGVTELARFVEEPVKGFVTRRLGFSLREVEARGEDLVPVHLGGLQAWAVGDRMLRGRMAGDEPADQHIAERRRGSLPPGALADSVLDDIESRVAALHATADGANIVGVGTTVRVDCAVADGTRLVGNIVGLHGSRLGVVQYSRLKAKHRIGAFVRVAALTRLDPDTAWDAVVVGREGEGDVACVRIGPLGADPETRRRAADEALSMLIDLWDRGMREPLPIYPETTGAFAMARGDKSEWKKARAAWVTSWQIPREDQDLYHRLVLGGVAPITALWADSARPDERGDGWPDARSRFEAYALRLWTPVIAVMEGLPQ